GSGRSARSASSARRSRASASRRAPGSSSALRPGRFARRRSRQRERAAPAGVVEHTVGDEHGDAHVAEPESQAEEQIGQGPAAERRLADRAHAPGWRQHPRDRADPPRQQRQRNEEAADQPDRILEEVPEHPGGPEPHERYGEKEPEAAEREYGADDRKCEQKGVGDRQRDAEDEV